MAKFMTTVYYSLILETEAEDSSEAREKFETMDVEVTANLNGLNIPMYCDDVGLVWRDE